MVQLSTVWYGSETRCIHTTQSLTKNYTVAEASVVKNYNNRALYQGSTKMDAMLAFLLIFRYWRSFATRRAVVLRKRRRLFEAQRLIEVARRQLRRLNTDKSLWL